jgi:hypothetical protein
MSDLLVTVNSPTSRGTKYIEKMYPPLSAEYIDWTGCSDGTEDTVLLLSETQFEQLIERLSKLKTKYILETMPANQPFKIGSSREYAKRRIERTEELRKLREG